MSIKETLKNLLYSNEIARKYYYLFTVDPSRYIEEYHEALINREINWDNIGRRMKLALVKFGCVYDEFFMFGLYNKSDSQINEFITDCKRYKYYQIFNSKTDDALFDNKWKTYEKLYSYYQREAILISSKSDINSFIEFVSKHDSVIVKQLSLSCGKGVKFYSDLQGDDIKRAFSEIIADSPCMVEEIIVQSELMKRLNPSSVNTIRINTIMDRNGHVTLFYPFLKVGRVGMRVDNAGAGGIVCGIDAKTGIIRTNGVDEMGREYVKNPELDYLFLGLQLPDWQDAVDKAIELQNLFPGHRCTGWDFAHTDNKWVLVEGNSGGQFVGQQMVDQVGRRFELEKLL